MIYHTVPRRASVSELAYNVRSALVFPRMSLALLWIPVTLVAAGAQTARNAMQHHLTARLGTLGATQVRFLYGLPFAVLFLAALCLLEGRLPPGFNPGFWIYTIWGALTQIAATALMLATMRLRQFGLAIAYTKTEPMQVAVFGWLLLGDVLSWQASGAVAIATLGVVLMSRTGMPAGSRAGFSWRPALLGLASGAGFALSSIGFRGAILSLESGSALLRASTTLTCGLLLQSLLLLIWLGFFQRDALIGSLRAWRSSLFAGFMGALASQCWFFGFALTSTANVRTLGLIEVVFAQIASRRVFAQTLSRTERLGLILVTLGVALLLLDVLGGP
ncbi:MAG: DMT family transporter [Pigmentiphaga sp.]